MKIELVRSYQEILEKALKIATDIGVDDMELIPYQKRLTEYLELKGRFDARKMELMEITPYKFFKFRQYRQLQSQVAHLTDSINEMKYKLIDVDDNIFFKKIVDVIEADVSSQTVRTHSEYISDFEKTKKEYLYQLEKELKTGRYILRVPGVILELYKNKAYELRASEFVIPGFRKGKAPRRMVEAMHDIGIFNEEATKMCVYNEFNKRLWAVGMDDSVRRECTITTSNDKDGVVAEVRIIN